jgi:hypothetical protein
LGEPLRAPHGVPSALVLGALASGYALRGCFAVAPSPAPQAAQVVPLLSLSLVAPLVRHGFAVAYEKKNGFSAYYFEEGLFISRSRRIFSPIKAKLAQRLFERWSETVFYAILNLNF